MHISSSILTAVVLFTGLVASAVDPAEAEGDTWPRIVPGRRCGRRGGKGATSTCLSNSQEVVTETAMETVTMTVDGSAPSVTSSPVLPDQSTSAGTGGSGSNAPASATSDLTSSASKSVDPAQTTNETPPILPTDDDTTKPVDTTATAAPLSTATGTGQPSEAPSSRPVSTGGKKGLTYNDASLLAGYTGPIKWVMNWAQSNAGVPAGMKYYPMLWNAAPDATSKWAATAQAAIDRGDGVLFGFNEPHRDQCPAQACMLDIAAAAAAWKEHMQPWQAKGATLVSPAISQGQIAEEWLTDFLKACPPSECGIEAIALHWYEGAHQIEYFKDYLTKASQNPAFGGLPIWLTEFAPNAGTDAEKAVFIKEATTWMDGQSFIHAYAYWWAEAITPGGQPNALGQAYMG